MGNLCELLFLKDDEGAQNNAIMIEHDSGADGLVCQVCFVTDGQKSLSKLKRNQLQQYVAGQADFALLTWRELRALPKDKLQQEDFRSRILQAKIFDSVLVASACNSAQHVVCIGCLARLGAIASKQCVCSASSSCNDAPSLELPSELVGKATRQKWAHDWINSLKDVDNFEEDLEAEPITKPIAIPCPTCGIALHKTTACNDLWHCGELSCCWCCGEIYPTNQADEHFARTCYGCVRNDVLDSVCDGTCTNGGEEECNDESHEGARLEAEYARRKCLLARFEALRPTFNYSWDPMTKTYESEDSEDNGEGLCDIRGTSSSPFWITPPAIPTQNWAKIVYDRQ